MVETQYLKDVNRGLMKPSEYCYDTCLKFDEASVSSQQVGREQTSAQPVFSDFERVYCKVAAPGQKRLRRSEGSDEYSYADAVQDRVARNLNVARQKSSLNFFQSEPIKICDYYISFIR
ncbi:hypothetical protein HELRODRAFT_167956 [Helobdella robusta]|uniref:Uncharacterized protein n=1 Tax=Helobdella robusta TaxID=6412 RepID=T1F002_HELRO|nr:hypothetical protein HELRODRAFT_167956 [Helobdella robusta]ESO10100.1 hypothetical protein HELRODRAFT_167956 [Helobdella robusta]